MSARAALRRQQRDDARLDGYVETNFWPMPATHMHGVCRRCPRQTLLTLPLATCKRCTLEAAGLAWAALWFGVKL